MDAPATPIHTGARPPARLRYSHEAMIDLIVMRPGISQNELAQTFGYTPAWVSVVMSTGMFRAALAARREELVDPAIRATLDERFQAVVTRSLEVLQEKLSAPSLAIPDNLALRAAEMGAKALGLGGNAPPPAPAVSEDHLSSLAERLIALQSKTRERISYEVQDVEAKVAQGQQEGSEASRAAVEIISNPDA